MAEDTEMAIEPALEPARLEPAPADVPEHAEHAPETAPETAPVRAPESTTVPAPASARPKRRIRTRTLYAAAASLGVIGGVVGGYTIQALREPTPLPPLAVGQPTYPRGPVFDGIRPPALPAAQDDATILDGDLTKLLLPTPAGATAGFYDHEWVELSVDAADCTSPGQCLATGHTRVPHRSTGVGPAHA